MSMSKSGEEGAEAESAETSTGAGPWGGCRGSLCPPALKDVAPLAVPLVLAASLLPVGGWGAAIPVSKPDEGGAAGMLGSGSILEMEEGGTCCLPLAASVLDACGDATTEEEADDSLASGPSLSAPLEGWSWLLEARLEEFEALASVGEGMGSSSGILVSPGSWL
jgi:hypothetical protein